MFAVQVDGVVAEALGCRENRNRPCLLEATARLGARQQRTVVSRTPRLEWAGRSGGFALVIGVDRTGHAEELQRSGADAVVSDLADVSVAQRRKADVAIYRTH